eukprot:730106_1
MGSRRILMNISNQFLKFAIRWQFMLELFMLTFLGESHAHHGHRGESGHHGHHNGHKQSYSMDDVMATLKKNWWIVALSAFGALMLVAMMVRCIRNRWINKKKKPEKSGDASPGEATDKKGSCSNNFAEDTLRKSDDIEQSWDVEGTTGDIAKVKKDATAIKDHR